jgi:hypothetical protein
MTNPMVRVAMSRVLSVIVPVWNDTRLLLDAIDGIVVADEQVRSLWQDDVGASLVRRKRMEVGKEEGA